MISLILGRYLYKREPVLFLKTDETLISVLAKIKLNLYFFNKKTAGLFAHYILEKTERFFLRVFRKLKNVVKKHNDDVK